MIMTHKLLSPPFTKPPFVNSRGTVPTLTQIIPAYNEVQGPHAERPDPQKSDLSSALCVSSKFLHVIHPIQSYSI